MINAFHQPNGWTGEFRPFYELGQGGATEHTTEFCRKIRSRKQTLGLVSNTSLFMGYLPLNLRFDWFTNGNNERKCQGPNYGRFVPCFISMNIVHYFSPGKFAVFFNI